MSSLFPNLDGNSVVPERKRVIFCHVKEDTDCRRGVLSDAAQGNPQAGLWACGPRAQAGAEIAQKRRFWTRTSESASPSAATIIRRIVLLEPIPSLRVTMADVGFEPPARRVHVRLEPG